MNIKHILCGAACAAAALPALACFTVYDRANRVVYNAQTPPVDMRYQIHETLPRLFPGGHMVFDDSTDCPVAQPRAIRPGDTAARLGTTDRDMEPAAFAPAVQMDNRDMVFTELRDPPVMLYGRLNPPVR